MALSSEIEFFAATDVGRKRAHNEDNFLVDKEIGLFMVCDGMGGHAAGEIASALAVRTMHQELDRERSALRDRGEKGGDSEVSVKQVLALLDHAVQCASQRINTEAQRDVNKRGMGTTLSALMILDSYAFIAHVGDSRIYLFRQGVLHQITEDHTVGNELIRAGFVTAAEVDRVPRRNAITRAVGVYERAEVDTLSIEVLPDDQFLVASDGLTGYFTDPDEAHRLVATPDGEVAVRGLIEFANAKGGKDNITAILVRLGRGDARDTVRARRLRLKREALAHMPLFQKLDDRELLNIMQLADVLQFEAGQTVVREGERGDELFIALTGKLRITHGTAVLGHVSPGDHFGEMALIRSGPRSATVTAVEPSELLIIRRDAFFEVIRTDPRVAVKLLWQFLGVLANRLEQTSRDLSQAREELDAESSEVPQGEEADPFAQPPSSLGAMRLSFRGGQEGAPPPAFLGVLSARPAAITARAAKITSEIDDDHDQDDADGTDDAARPAALADSGAPTLRRPPFGDTPAPAAPPPMAQRRFQDTLRSTSTATAPKPEARPTPVIEDSDSVDHAAAPEPTPRVAPPRPSSQATVPSAPPAPQVSFEPVAVTEPIVPREPIRKELDRLREEYRQRLEQAAKKRRDDSR